MFKLSGKTAVVTGASSGLGRAMAKALAGQGANIVVLARRFERLVELQKEIEQTAGVKCLPIQCDVTVEADVKRAAEQVEREFGGADILINNAGGGHTSPLVSYELDKWHGEFNVDVHGAFLCTREFGKSMLKKHYGRIINIASMYGLVGNTAIGCSAYHAAKGAVVNFTRAVAAEWAREGVVANCICPGYFATEMTEATLADENFQKHIDKSVPMGRCGKMEELCSLAIFLASEEVSYITGAIIPIDGGYTAV